MKLFICSDVHSYYTELMAGLKAAGFDINNEEHIFVSLGDLLDRGSFPRKCLEFVNSLPQHRKILIKGNHEDLLDAVLRRGYFEMHDWWNGTADTIQYLSDYAIDPYSIFEDELIDSARKNPEWSRYYNSLVPYAEIGDYIFVHGWIPLNQEDNGARYDPEWRKKNFSSAVWYNGQQAWHSGLREPGKTIVCGHIHSHRANIAYHGMDPNTTPLHELCKPFKDDGIICIDSDTPASKIVNIEVIEI